MKPLDLSAYYLKNETEVSLGYVVTILVAFCFVSFSYILNDLTELTVINVASFAFWTILLIKKRGIIDITVIFYVLCYLFHCSYFILIAADNLCGNAYVFITLPEFVQISTLKFCNYFVSLFPIGALIVRSEKNYNDDKVFLTIEKL